MIDEWRDWKRLYEESQRQLAEAREALQQKHDDMLENANQWAAWKEAAEAAEAELARLRAALASHAFRDSFGEWHWNDCGLASRGVCGGAAARACRELRAALEPQKEPANE